MYCKETLKGRSDKKFCNAQCKSAYHNQAESTSEAFIRSVNKQLRIACPQGKATVRNLYYFCYDYGYTPSVDSEKVVVIQQQNYMNNNPIH